MAMSGVEHPPRAGNERRHLAHGEAAARLLGADGVPIGMALLAQRESPERAADTTFSAAIMLGVAYGTNLGGIGTKHMFSWEQTL